MKELEIEDVRDRTCRAEQVMKQLEQTPQALDTPWIVGWCLHERQPLRNQDEEVPARFQLEEKRRPKVTGAEESPVTAKF